MHKNLVKLLVYLSYFKQIYLSTLELSNVEGEEAERDLEEEKWSNLFIKVYDRYESQLISDKKTRTYMLRLNRCLDESMKFIKKTETHYPLIFAYQAFKGYDKEKLKIVSDDKELMEVVNFDISVLFPYIREHQLFNGVEFMKVSSYISNHYWMSD